MCTEPWMMGISHGFANSGCINQHSHICHKIHPKPNQLIHVYTNKSPKDSPVPVSVEAKLFFVEPGCRWAHRQVHPPVKLLIFLTRILWKPKCYIPQEVSNCYMVLLSVSSGASVGCLRVCSFSEPWLVRLSAAKSWVLAEGFPRGAPLSNFPSFTPVHH